MFEINPFSLLALFGITIVVGYVGSLIFDKTKISDVVWLLVFGILVGPVFNLVDRNLFLIISPFLASLALLVILFDAGLNMDFYQMIRGAPRGLLLAVVGVALEIAVISTISIYFLKFGLLESLLLGSILGGTSSPIVLAIVNRLKIEGRTKTILSLESVFTDPLVIVIAIALINFIAGNGSGNPVQSILSSFSIGAVAGLIIGIIWLFVLDRLKGKPFDYMLTLAIAFLIYVAVENSGGSGAIASLAFGIVLGNGSAFSAMLKFKKKFGVDSMMKTFQSEISFFIRSFFFVYIGIIAAFSQTYLIYGLAIAAAAIVIRLVAVQISTLRMAMPKIDRNIMRVMTPKGLAAAVLAQLPLNYGLPNAEAISNIVFIVIVVTVLYSTFATMAVNEGSNKKAEKKEKKRE